MNKDRKRNKNNRKSKRVILVAFEGKNKTEKIYFDSFKGINKDYVIKTVPGNETDPVNLVKQTIQKSKELRLDLDDDDRAFCVFDTDSNPTKNVQIKKAIELANNKKIGIITTSPCIELWFLLHYEYTTSNMTNDEVRKRLKEFYPKYEKNINIYPGIIEKLDMAIKRAKKLEKYQKENGRDIQSVEANPHSDVYRIIEELKK